jgi:hypothetical protein
MLDRVRQAVHTITILLISCHILLLRDIRRRILNGMPIESRTLLTADIEPILERRPYHLPGPPSEYQRMRDDEYRNVESHVGVPVRRAELPRREIAQEVLIHQSKGHVSSQPLIHRYHTPVIWVAAASSAPPQLIHEVADIPPLQHVDAEELDTIAHSAVAGDVGRHAAEEVPVAIIQAVDDHVEERYVGVGWYLVGKLAGVPQEAEVGVEVRELLGVEDVLFRAYLDHDSGSVLARIVGFRCLVFVSRDGQEW